MTGRWPGVLVQWEDFANHNAFRLLERYRGRICTFNDDIQGTGAVAAAGVFAAARARNERVTDQRLVFFGAGEAASGIASQIVEGMVAEGTSLEEARSRIWMLDSRGLIVKGNRALARHKEPYARRPADVEGWDVDDLGSISLASVVRHTRPTILIGTSGQPNTFTEEVIRTMAEATDQPLIMPMSNPTSQAECSPALAYAWSEGRCLVATGSPFAPVEYDGVRHRIGQANNAFIFPGVGLGAIVVQARHVTDAMFRSAAHGLTRMVAEADFSEGALYPPVSDIRKAAREVAIAVAREALTSGEATRDIAEADVPARIDEAMWYPEYAPRVDQGQGSSPISMQVSRQ